MRCSRKVKRLADGAAVFDAVRLPAGPDSCWFDADWWRTRGPVSTPSGGRGSALVVRTPAGAAVLRHYRRGGLMARVNPDRYLWQGEDRTRPFREFDLLAEMVAEGLPAPAPLAARYTRIGPWYRADLLTQAIEDANTLGQRLTDAPSQIDWALIGATIGRFHARGFFHADLNAHNVLLCGTACHLIDFDRGERRATAPAWMQANLARLRRSLDKLSAAQRLPDFDGERWLSLQRAHAQIVEKGA
jgi:3-deoxy-D-manno-octulosonic acid kinase